LDAAGYGLKREAFDRVVPVGVAFDAVDVVLETGEALSKASSVERYSRSRPSAAPELSPGIRIGIPGG
jgi:hypothetical protein